MEEEGQKTVYQVEFQGEQEARAALEGLEEHAARLKEQLAALKEEPLEVAPEGELPKPPGKKKKKEDEEEGGQQAAKKKDKKEEKESVKRVSGMISSGLVQGFKSGDVKGAMADMGASMATSAATSLVTEGISSILSMIPGLGMITSLLGFQHEGLVSRPTLAMVGEREPEFVVTQERMRALLSGGRPGYGFGPGDFGSAPNVNVGSPSVNVEVTMNPGVDADIQTAYRARAGEARL
jgi:hypothetical protein